MEIKSEYLSKFTDAKISLFGNKLLIEKLELPEKRTAGGIIVGTANNMRKEAAGNSLVVLILACGKGYFEADSNSYVEMEAHAGNVIIVNPAGCQFFETLPGTNTYCGQKVGLTTEGDIQLAFENIQEFEKYLETMSK